MNAITRQARRFGTEGIGALILVIAVWGTLGLQAQALPETAAITAPTATIAVPAAIAAPAAAVAIAKATT